MALLFVAAGVGSRYAVEWQTLGEFLTARTQKLLVSYNIGLFAFRWIYGFIKMKITGAFDEAAANVSGLALYLIMAVGCICKYQ